MLKLGALKDGFELFDFFSNKKLFIYDCSIWGLNQNTFDSYLKLRLSDVQMRDESIDEPFEVIYVLESQQWFLEEHHSLLNNLHKNASDHAK